MKFYEMKKIGVTVLLAIAATSAFSLDASAASKNDTECKMTSTTSPTYLGYAYDKGDGTFIEGKCFAAMNALQTKFDLFIDDELKNDPLVVTALNTMKKEAKTNPEAANLQNMYRTARAEFINEFLKENNSTKLSSKNDGGTYSEMYAEKAEVFMNKEDVMSRIKALKEPIHNQAKKMIIAQMN